MRTRLGSIGDQVTFGVRNYWLPLGLFVLLSGFYWLPHSHYYKVLLPPILLFPSLIVLVLLRPSQLGRAQLAVLLPVLIYLLYMCLLALAKHQIDDAIATAKWDAYIAIFLVGAGLGMHINRPHLTLLLLSCAVIAAIAAIYALARDIQSGALFADGYRLIGYGSLYNPLRSGHLWGAFSVVAVWCALQKTLGSWQRRVAWLVAGVCAAATLLTGSRAPLLAMLAVALWAIIIDTQGARRNWLLLATTVLVSTFLALFWHSLSERGMSLRPELWHKAWRLSLEHPWLGVGFGHPLEMTASNGQLFYDTHNVFLAALYYGGAVGLLLFLIAFGGAFFRAWWERKHLPACYLAALLQLYGLVTLQFDGGCLISRPDEFWILFWLPMLLYLNAISTTPEHATNRLTAAPGIRV